MEVKTKAAINKLIEVMEELEKEIRAKMADKDEQKYIPKDRFMAGWSHGIHLSWEHMKPQPKWDFEGKNEITCFYEFNGIDVSGHRFDEKTDVDLMFLTKDIFQNDIVPALRTWAQNKVDNEPFGGLFGSYFCITTTLSTSREVRDDDPPHRQGESWEQEYIKVTDEKRIEQFRQMVYDFIDGEEYKTEDINEIDNSLGNICTHAVKDFYKEFGNAKLMLCFETLLVKAKEAKFKSTVGDLMHAFANAAATLTNTEDGREPSENELELACKLCILILQNGTNKYEKDSGRAYLKSAAELGYKQAKDIMKFGTGQIPMEIVQYKDKLINCAANDIDKIVDIKIKEESAEAYVTAVRYLTRLLQNGFPGEYAIKCNTKVKNYIDTDLKSTKTNNFFANAAQYPEAYDALKEYFCEAFDAYNYYSDASDEEAVTCGGYAAMALSFADPEKNFDIGLEFLEHSDFEHAITSRYFADDFASVLKGEKKKQILKYLEEF